jgi:ribosomal protein S18 acetylase RimI-like enzyme
MKIRPMVHNDKVEIMKILRTTPEFTPAEVAVAEEVIDSYLQISVNSDYHILVAEVGSSLAGYICYGPTPLTEGTWDIYWIAVDPEHQRQGVGHNLLAFAENIIMKAKGRLILIETSSKEEYEKARDFYQKQGYKLIGHIPDFYASGDDKLILQKKPRHA